MLYVKKISTTKNDPFFFSLGCDNLPLYKEGFVNNFTHGRVSLQKESGIKKVLNSIVLWMICKNC